MRRQRPRGGFADSFSGAGDGCPLAGRVCMPPARWRVGILEPIVPRSTPCARQIDRCAHLPRGDLELDLALFVTFSSIAAAWGSAGQAPTRRATPYLDGCRAAARQRVGGISVAWGPWAGAGMATDDDKDPLLASCLNRSGAGVAIAALARAVGNGAAHSVVAT